MKTVKEVSRISGVSVRTLHYYHSIGLLHPTQITDSGYRLYDDAALQRLYCILLFRELEFPLKEIKRILQSEQFDQQAALQKQIEWLKQKRDYLDQVISHACQIQKTGVNAMSFQSLNKAKLQEYEAEAKQRWGDTAAYKEYEQKRKGKELAVDYDLMNLFVQFGQLQQQDPACQSAQELVAALQNHITEHYYTCTNEILNGLGMMYTADERMQQNIDQAGGEGTAAFVQKAIEEYCKKQ